MLQTMERAMTRYTYGRSNAEPERTAIPVVQIHVTIETVRIASQRARITIENLTDKISQEVGAEANKASSRE